MSGPLMRFFLVIISNSALWLAPEDVLICEAPIPYQGRTVMTYDIINRDEGEKVGAQRLR